MDDGGKIQALQGLRGAMAWWVVAGHISKTFGWNLGLIDRNGLAVSVFILLSGFVIALLIDRKREGFGAFITRRGFRLFPLYLFALIVSAALLPVQSAAWQALAPTPMNLARASLATTGIEQFATQFAWHLPLAQGLLPAPAPYTILGQAWSISLEWQFYLIAPLLYLGLTNRRFTPLAAAVAGALVLMSPALSNAFIGSNLALFLVGMTSYLALSNRSWICASAMLGALILLEGGPWLAIPLAIWTLVLVAAVTASWPARLLASRFACYLGEISYSTYLLHMIPLFGSVYLLTAWGVEGPALQVAVATFTVAGTLAASTASYRFIELPAIKLGAKLTKQSQREMVSQTS